MINYRNITQLFMFTVHVYALNWWQWYAKLIIINPLSLQRHFFVSRIFRACHSYLLFMLSSAYVVYETLTSKIHVACVQSCTQINFLFAKKSSKRTPSSWSHVSLSKIVFGIWNVILKSSKKFQSGRSPTIIIEIRKHIIETKFTCVHTTCINFCRMKFLWFPCVWIY